MNIRQLFLAGLVATLASPTMAQEQISPDMAVRFGGKTAMVCGVVESAKYAENTEGQPTFLHMGAKFPRHTFAVRIMGEHRGKWPEPPENLVGKLVCASGAIKRAGGNRAEMELDSPSNMKLGVAK